MASILKQIKNDPYLFKALVVAVISRVFVYVVAILGDLFVDVKIADGLWRASTPFFNLFAVWDSAYYMVIALHGYTETIYWGFFPLYPIAIKLMSYLFFFSNEPALLSGFFVSNIFFILLIIYFYRLTLLIFKKREIAFYSTLFLSISPASVFFSAVYTESLFMFLLIASFYYMEKESWQKSAIFGFLAGLTKIVGFWIFLPLLYKIISDNRQKKHTSILIYPIFVLSSYVVFMFYGYLKTGNLFVYHISKLTYWDIGLHNPIYQFFMLNRIDQLIIFPFIILSIVSLLYFFKSKKLIPYTIHSFVLLLIYLITVSPISFPRYSLTIIPIFWYLSTISIKDKNTRFLLYLFSILMLAHTTILFVNWYDFY